MKMYISRCRHKTSLILSEDYPAYDAEKDTWYYISGFITDDRLFPEVTFENSPMEVELVLKR